MHVRTHVGDEHRGRCGHGDSVYLDGMTKHDETIRARLGAPDAMGVAETTPVACTSANGPHMNTRPDAAMTPFRGEKNSNREGAVRVPMLAATAGNPALIAEPKAGTTLTGGRVHRPS
jgi:arylsulfatase